VKILLTTAHPFLPELAGGMQMCGDTLARQMATRGHEVAISAGLAAKGWSGMNARLRLKLSRQNVISDHHLGYRIWRSWFPWENAAHVAAQYRPDVIVVMAGKPVKIAAAFQETGIPLIMWLQNVEFNDHFGEFSELGQPNCVANSRFTADTYQRHFGVAPVVIHPIVKAENYATPAQGDMVTLVNPHPHKGLAVALEMARRCPDIPFLFVQTWDLNAEDQANLDRNLAELPNITLHPPVQDMRQIYSRTKILLAPSRWQEGYGRVATEAQFSGIPVIASTQGGLPEAVGPGGMLLPADAPADDWVAALRRLWDDQAIYQQASAAARAHSKRPANDPARQADQWETLLLDIAGRGSTGQLVTGLTEMSDVRSSRADIATRSVT
jgi:glycosyltransferase involved in cell wall biosynthesis